MISKKLIRVWRYLQLFMSHKKMQPSTSETRRLLFYVVSLSLLLLFISCSTLLKYGSASISPHSVLIPRLANNTTKTSDTKIKSSTSPLHPLSPPDISNIRTDSENIYRVNPGDEKVLHQMNNGACDPNKALLRVYMYDLPPEFHFELMGWKGKKDQIWPDVDNPSLVPRYPGGLNLQHSVEYWLTLDLLSSNINRDADRPCTAIRVKDSRQADVIFVPFFSSLSYNRHSKLHEKQRVTRNRILQDELVKFLKEQEDWKRWGGKDHLIVAHHPNSMSEARVNVSSAMLVLADFGRYPVEMANVKKDIIAPYRHLVNSVGNDSAPFDGRPVLLFFKGAIYRKDGGMIRQELHQLLKDEKDVHFTYGSARENGISHVGQGMASSKFCLNIAGDTPSSNRLFDAIVSHCVPVVISDEIELPFEDVLDYSEFCLFVRSSDALKKGFLLNLLRGITHDEWTMMWESLKKTAHHFEYQYPSEPGDAVQMIWEAIARKTSSVQLKLNRENRFRQLYSSSRN